ncbi:hypothetical protein WA026_017405 [Henosepilachna vigintioctopunctata]|uniref:Endosome-associated-trafficking regulator 1 n=1 Tax=Henosepilachna vigintioctopunctata TaxID=420089 RepID=A0AAW1VF90_9CUCU
MAEGDGLSPDRKKRGNGTHSNNGDDPDITGQFVELDLGDDNLRKTDIYRLGNLNNGAGPSSVEGSRREDNPFSFKHFLQCDSNYLNKGARPKVYPNGRHSTIRDTQGQTLSDNPSALPDFVQDHLVIEQCFLSNEPTSNYNIGAQLPDFTQNSHNSRQDVEVNTGFENFPNGNDVPGLVRPQADFPLDLPTTLNNERLGNINEVAVSKSLPDFLNDGAVRSQTAENMSTNQSPERDYERLQRELELVRRQLVEQTIAGDLMKKELEGMRNQEHEYTQNLIKALEQVEDNLERSNKRAITAEATILNLKHELTMIKKENSALKAECLCWGGTEGAAGGPRQSTHSNHSQRLAQELRSAASTAEVSLRQLLLGVDNLRLMASTLENMHRIEERNEHFLNTEENSGPAL